MDLPGSDCAKEQSGQFQLPVYLGNSDPSAFSSEAHSVVWPALQDEILPSSQSQLSPSWALFTLAVAKPELEQKGSCCTHLAWGPTNDEQELHEQINAPLLATSPIGLDRTKLEHDIKLLRKHA